MIFVLIGYWKTSTPFCLSCQKVHHSQFFLHTSKRFPIFHYISVNCFLTAAVHSCRAQAENGSEKEGGSVKSDWQAEGKVELKAKDLHRFTSPMWANPPIDHANSLKWSGSACHEIHCFQRWCDWAFRRTKTQKNHNKKSITARLKGKKNEGIH